MVQLKIMGVFTKESWIDSKDIKVVPESFGNNIMPEIIAIFY